MAASVGERRAFLAAAVLVAAWVIFLAWLAYRG